MPEVRAGWYLIESTEYADANKINIYSNIDRAVITVSGRYSHWKA